jgi:hypothetical protein
MQFLVGAAATTTVGMHLRIAGEFAPFTLLAALFLIVDLAWLGVALLRGFSSVAPIARHAKSNIEMLIASAMVWCAARVASGDAVFADQSALGVLAAFNVFDIWRLIRRYESFDAF